MIKLEDLILTFEYKGRVIKAHFEGYSDSGISHCNYMHWADTSEDVPEYVFEAIMSEYKDMLDLAIVQET